MTRTITRSSRHHQPGDLPGRRPAAEEGPRPGLAGGAQGQEGDVPDPGAEGERGHASRRLDDRRRR